ncbi:hypothetical protein D3C87_1848840 [compost metagenome]
MLIYYLVRRLSGFRWTHDNIVAITLFAGLSIFVLAGVELLPFWQGLICALTGTAVGCWLSLQQLVRLVPQRWIPTRLRPIVYFVLRHERVVVR